MNELIVKEPFNFSIIETMESVNLTEMSFMDRTKLYCEVEAKSFYLRGRILQSIKEDNCFKEAGYETFEKAVKDILSISRSFAYRIMDATTTYETLSPTGRHFLPTSERQLRPLTGLEPEQQIEVWQEVAKDKVPTAKEVQKAVNKKLGKNVDNGSQDLPVTSLEVPIVPIEDITAAKTYEILSTRVDILPTENNSTIDMSKYITIEEHNRIVLEYEKAYMIDIEKLMNRVSELESRLSFFEKDSINPTPEKSTLLPRETVFNFVKQHGNAIQCLALLSDYLTNERLYNLFVKVREDYKMTTPPPAWDLEIINATGILSF
jgi:hypothetical protein